jgi:hypothetical protein
MFRGGTWRIHRRASRGRYEACDTPNPPSDILAHPGFLSLEEDRLSAASGKFLKISSHKGYYLSNKHTDSSSRQVGA